MPQVRIGYDSESGEIRSTGIGGGGDRSLTVDVNTLPADPRVEPWRWRVIDGALEYLEHATPPSQAGLPE
jgi:hypothetical protein